MIVQYYLAPPLPWRATVSFQKFEAQDFESRGSNPRITACPDQNVPGAGPIFPG